MSVVARTIETGAMVLVGAASVAVLAFASDPLLFVRDRRAADLALTQFQDDLAAYRQRPIPFERLDTLRHAVPAFEDRSFDSRPLWAPPISPSGVARALLMNTRGVRAGGSTILQQVAKQELRKTSSPGLGEKWDEAFLASEIGRLADADEILGVYLEKTAQNLLSVTPSSSMTAFERLSIALCGKPLSNIGREDQFLLASAPRGLQVMRRSPDSAARLASAREWMIDEGTWNPRVSSYLDDVSPTDVRSLFQFPADWTTRVSTAEAGSFDSDFVLAIGAFRSSLVSAIRASFPNTDARMAFALVGADGRVLARSGTESFAMKLNYGSIGKVEVLSSAIDAVGPQRVREVVLPPEPSCVRWMWVRAPNNHDMKAASYCPTDVSTPNEPASLDSAVAKSINTLTVRHAVVWPFRFYLEAPGVFREVVDGLPPSEWTRLDSDTDRAISANLLTDMGIPTIPEDVPSELSYSALETAWFTYLGRRRSAAGLDDSLPLDPTSLLGNDSRASVEQVAQYMFQRVFVDDQPCAFTDLGWLLAAHKDEGTLRWLAARHRDLRITGKTGSSADSSSAVAAVGFCVDGRAVVAVGAVRAAKNTKLPNGFHGAMLLRGTEGFLSELATLRRSISSPELPEWAQAELETPLEVVDEL